MAFWLQIAAILTLPFDVVKTRRQLQLGEMDSLGGLRTSFIYPRSCDRFYYFFAVSFISGFICFWRWRCFLKLLFGHVCLIELHLFSLQFLWREPRPRGRLWRKSGRSWATEACLQVRQTLGFSRAVGVLWLMRCDFFLRVHAQSDQGGPGLRHHDQHLRVWEVLLPEDERGWRVSSNRKLFPQTCTE